IADPAFAVPPALRGGVGRILVPPRRDVRTLPGHPGILAMMPPTLPPPDPARARRHRSQVAAPLLFPLQGLEQCLEVALAEPAGAVPLDQLEEEGRPVLHRPGEDLQQ